MNGWIWVIAAVGVGAGVYLMTAKSGKSGSSTSKGIAPGEPNPGASMTIPKAPPVVPAGMADPIGKWEPQPPTKLPTTMPTTTPINPNPTHVTLPPPPIGLPDQLAHILGRPPVIADRPPLPIALPDQLPHMLGRPPVIADRT